MLGPGTKRISSGFDSLISFLTVIVDTKKFEDPHVHKEGLQIDSRLERSSSTKIMETNIFKPSIETVSSDRYQMMK